VSFQGKKIRHKGINFAVSLMAESRIHQESSELIPDPPREEVARDPRLFWGIWDQML